MRSVLLRLRRRSSRWLGVAWLAGSANCVGSEVSSWKGRSGVLGWRCFHCEQQPLQASGDVTSFVARFRQRCSSAPSRRLPGVFLAQVRSGVQNAGRVCAMTVSS